MGLYLYPFFPPHDGRIDMRLHLFDGFSWDGVIKAPFPLAEVFQTSGLSRVGGYLSLDDGWLVTTAGETEFVGNGGIYLNGNDVGLLWHVSAADALFVMSQMDRYRSVVAGAAIKPVFNLGQAKARITHKVDFLPSSGASFYSMGSLCYGVGYVTGDFSPAFGTISPRPSGFGLGVDFLGCSSTSFHMIDIVITRNYLDFVGVEINDYKVYPRWLPSMTNRSLYRRWYAGIESPTDTLDLVLGKDRLEVVSAFGSSLEGLVITFGEPLKAPLPPIGQVACNYNGWFFGMGPDWSGWYGHPGSAREVAGVHVNRSGPVSDPPWKLRSLEIDCLVESGGWRIGRV